MQILTYPRRLIWGMIALLFMVMPLLESGAMAEQVYNARTRRFEERPTRIQIDSSYRYQQPQPNDYYGSYSGGDPYRGTAYRNGPISSRYDRLESGVKDFWRSNPIRTGVVGGVIGLGAAAVRGRSLLRGSMIGLATGAGIGLIDDSPYFQAHPLTRGVSKGALIGATAATVTGAAALLPAAAVGAGVGAGVHYLRGSR